MDGKSGKKINYNITTSLETKPHTHQGAFKFEYQLEDRDNSVVYIDGANLARKKKKLKKKPIRKEKEKESKISCDIKITHISKDRPKTKGRSTGRAKSPKPPRPASPKPRDLLQNLKK
jgi:hypothetical protein